MAHHKVTWTHNFLSTRSASGLLPFKITSWAFMSIQTRLKLMRTIRTMHWPKWICTRTLVAVCRHAPKTGGCLIVPIAPTRDRPLTTPPTKLMEPQWPLTESCAYLSTKATPVMPMDHFNHGARKTLREDTSKYDRRVVLRMTILWSLETCWLIIRTVGLTCSRELRTVSMSFFNKIWTSTKCSSISTVESLNSLTLPKSSRISFFPRLKESGLLRIAVCLAKRSETPTQCFAEISCRKLFGQAFSQSC